MDAARLEPRRGREGFGRALEELLKADYLRARALGGGGALLLGSARLGRRGVLGVGGRGWGWSCGWAGAGVWLRVSVGVGIGFRGRVRVRVRVRV